MVIAVPMIAILAALQTVAPPRSLTLGEVKRARDAATAMALAPRVLPPTIAASVVRGHVQRRWLPGQVWWLGFRDGPRVVGADLCERTGYSVEASAERDAGGDTPDDTPLTLGKRERWPKIAVLPRGRRASAGACADAVFVPVARERERTIAAYRVLVAAMAAARGTGRLPFTIRCDTEAPKACADPRAALATLPMTALGAINVSCLDSETRREVSGGVTVVSCAPMIPGRPYQAEVSFGMSEPDGRSWRVAFVHRPGWPETIALRRSMVIYH